MFKVKMSDFVVGETSSEVHAVWEDEDNLAASIVTKNDVIIVEVEQCTVLYLPHVKFRLVEIMLGGHEAITLDTWPAMVSVE